MFKVLGITDEKTECECCGRTGLKRTVALDRTDAEGNLTGDVTYFGTDCAAKAICGTSTHKSVNRKAAESIAQLGRAIEYARKWLRHTEAHTAAIVARGIRNSRNNFAVVSEVGEYAIRFENGVTVEA
jgi:hypothetical protein